MPLVDMKCGSSMVPARKLTIIRPSHNRLTKSDPITAFDLFVVIDPFRHNTSEGTKDGSRQNWLRHCSSGALEHARVVAFGDVEPGDLSHPAAIERFSIELLSSILLLRHSTGTVCMAHSHPSS
jgi:hypothetical protein